ncbi:hypothetical protein [Staphylococcus epidermidis]
MQYLYPHPHNHLFIHNHTFHQIQLPPHYLKHQLNYLKPNIQLQLQSYQS